MRWIKLFAALSWVGTIEVAVTVFPFLMVMMLFSWWNMELEWLRWVCNVGVVYICVAWAIARICRWRSERSGLRYYYAIPVSNLLLRILLRDRVQVTKGSTCYLIHVNTRRKRHSKKAAIRDMQMDFRLLNNGMWGDRPLFIGNTFTDLGTVQMEMIQQRADVQVRAGTLLPLQSLMLTKRMIWAQQKRLFGSIIRKHSNPLWKIIVIRPQNRKESLS